MRNREPIVPCVGGGHRVRLAGGRRFFASARCPRCGGAVDPTRGRRIVAVVVNLLRPVATHPVDRLIHGAAVAWVVGIVAAAALLWAFADVWWPATILLFGPRWVLLLPGVPLLLWAAVRDRGWLVPLFIAGAVGAGPLVGLRTGWRTLLPVGSGPTLRVATLNARGGDDLPRIDELLGRWNADVVVFQECGGPLRDQVRLLGESPGSPVDVHTGSGLCLVTRLDLVDASQMDREALAFAGGAGLVWSYVLDWNGDPVRVTNLHLETQRAGLELFRRGQVREALDPLREKSFLRSVELRHARRWVDSLPAPRIVAGDFNTPPESRIYRQAWGDWTNAFDARGAGLGATRLNGWIQARIDHVLVDGAWRVVDVRVAEDVGSDHLPVVATLRRR